jgi:hypothetical protein
VTWKFLLLSNGIAATGLGNQHDLVGQLFMEHPHTKRELYCADAAARERDLRREVSWTRRCGAHVRPGRSKTERRVAQLK